MNINFLKGEGSAIALAFFVPLMFVLGFGVYLYTARLEAPEGLSFVYDANGYYYSGDANRSIFVDQNGTLQYRSDFIKDDVVPGDLSERGPLPQLLNISLYRYDVSSDVRTPLRFEEAQQLVLDSSNPNAEGYRFANDYYRSDFLFPFGSSNRSAYIEKDGKYFRLEMEPYQGAFIGWIVE